MKELSIEEKVKRYDEALERAKNTIEVNQAIPDIVECVESLFPELMESEDEKIRKALIRYFTLSDEHAYDEACGVSYRDIVDWLEKQGDQKQEWSEEDESRIITICTYLQDYARLSGSELRTIRINEYCDWLKSLKERYAWMPSDKQMEAVRLAAEIGTANNSWAMNILKSMYQDLQKLREE